MKSIESKALRFFLFGQMISLVGSKISHFAIGFWLYEQTHSVSSYALVLFLSFLPNIIGSFLAGPIVDRYSFKLTFGGGDILAGLMTVTTAIVLYSQKDLGNFALIVIYGMIFLNGVVSALQWVALNSFLPTQFAGNDLVRYNGYLSTATSFASLLAPAMAGLIGTILSVHYIVLIDGLTYLVSGSVVIFMLTSSPAKPKRESIAFLKEIKAGIDYLRRSPEVFTIVILFFVFNFFSGLNASLTPPLYIERYATQGSGLILTAMGAGSLLIAFIQGVKPQWIKFVPNLYGPMIFIGLINIAIGYFSTFYAVLTCVLILGGLISMTNSKASLLLQEKAESEFRGRVFATARGLSWICLPAAQLMASALGGTQFMQFLKFESKTQYLGSVVIIINLVAIVSIILTTHYLKKRT